VTHYELVNALEALGYADSLPVMIDNGTEWLTPVEVRLDDDRVIIRLEPF
jgi:hypothetical protein